MKAIALAVGCVALVSGLFSIGDTLFVRRAPTDSVLEMAAQIAPAGELGRLKAIAEAGPSTPLARMMSAGLLPRRSAASLDQVGPAMDAALEENRWLDRWLWLIAIGGAAAALGMFLSVAAARTASVGVVAGIAVLFGFLAWTVANTTARDLERAHAVLRPMLVAAPFSTEAYQVMPKIKSRAWAESEQLVFDPAGPPELVTVYVIVMGDHETFIDEGLQERIGVDRAELKREAFRNIEKQ